MGLKTSIGWTGSTWNPIRARDVATGKIGWHCTHVSEGCRFCYAESMNRRLGTQHDYKPVETKTGGVEIFLDDKMLMLPFTKKWSQPGRVFPCSMTDMFADFVTDDILYRMFAVMALASHLTYQILTKRPERMREFCRAIVDRESSESTAVAKITGAIAYRANMAIEDAIVATGQEFLPNVWLGVSVEDQSTAHRMQTLRETPAALRWVSYEPAIGPVDFCEHLGIWWLQDLTMVDGGMWMRNESGGPYIDWGVCGGESGRNARIFDLSWGQTFLRQFAAAGKPAFMKQVGAKPAQGDWMLNYRHPKGEDASEWPEHLRVQEFPQW